MSMAKNSLSAAFTRRTTPATPALPPTVVFIRLLAYCIAVMAILYPGTLASFSGIVVAKYGLMAGLRWGIAVLGIYVITNRRLAFWEPLAVLAAVFGLLGNYAQAMGSPVPITVSDTCLRLALGAFIVRLLFRPTPAEDRLALAEAQQEIKALKARLEEYEP